MTRWCRCSSRCSSFCTSPSISWLTGMPVQRATTSAMSSSSTSSFIRRVPPSRLGERLFFGCELASPARAASPYLSSATRFRSYCRSAFSISSLVSSMRRAQRRAAGRWRPSPLPSGRAARRRRRCSSASSFSSFSSRPREALSVSFFSASRSISSCMTRRDDLVELGRHRVDLGAQLGRRLVDQVDGLVGQEAVGDVAVRQHRRGRPGRCP